MSPLVPLKPSLVLLAITAFSFATRDASGAILYRIGTPFTAAEKDSLDRIGVDYLEVDWSTSQVLDAVEEDSLQAGSLQPNFFAEEEDIAATLVSRGGKVWVNLFAGENNLTGLMMVDQDPTSAQTWAAIAPQSFSLRAFREKVTFDLGGRFLIREVRFRALEDRPEHFLEHFTISIKPDLGFKMSKGLELQKIVAQAKENTEPEIRLLLDPPVTTEAVQLRIYRTTNKEIGVADFELYGGGFVSKASYESDVIELDDIASLGEISWSGRQDPHARIDIRTRAGADPQPVIFWEARPEQQDSVRFLQGGGDLSLTEYAAQYKRLSGLFKPKEEADWESSDSENWSFWTSPYTFENPGVPVVSPGPRQYFQVSADFSSTGLDGGKIEYIEVKASSPPLVRELVGEIYPIETEVGETTHFTYYINPTILPEDMSFDGVEISTPSGVVSVDSLRIDTVDHGDFTWTINEDGLGFQVLFPRRLEPVDSGALVEVVFNAPVLREVGTVFDGRVFDTSRPLEVRQRVVPGDANDEVESERLSVRTALSRSLVFSPKLSPNPFTPNSDGVNEVVNISYKLLRVTSAVPVSIEIFDLSGRLVKRVYDGEDPIGEYSHVWDGTDNAGGVVAPGLYLYRLVADLHTDQETTSGIVAVAY